MKIFLTGICLCLSFLMHAQFTLKLVITSSHQPLPGATVRWKSWNKSFIADSTGNIIINNIPAGMNIFSFSHVEYESKELSFTITSDSTIEVSLEKEEEEEEEIVVTATRTSRTIANTPTRTEVISGEELDEKANMKPGDIRMLLNESTGIQTQQTSATSYNSSIRIQGLDGRYTQVLRDGFPLYAGFSGGLSLMQVAPLDLKQVEVIKGSSSTLYGGGAIAGLVNLVSKTPGNKRELSFMLNGTSGKELDASGFYSQKFKKAGITVFGSHNRAAAYDPANIGLTAIPKYQRYTISPNVFLYGKTSARIGFSYVNENRIGGSMDYIKNGTAGYFEKNKTDRFATQVAVTRKLSEHASISFKNSYNNFNRSIEVPGFLFSGLQQSSFSELVYSIQKEKYQWVLGANLITDDFEEDKINSLSRDYHYNTYGMFVQNAWIVNRIMTIESGLRGDFVNQYGFDLLPRISMLLKINPKLTARMGGGMGYKTPTVFNEEAERIQFQNILAINSQTTHNERSIGGNIDVNYRTRLGEVGLSINQLFFYTKLNHPLILTANGSNLEFVNANGHIDTRGWETNFKLTYKHFKLFLGYTYADVNTHFNNVKEWLPLTARNRLNNVLVYEREGNIKLGLEAYYFSPQKLNDGVTGKSYWVCGFMAEKFWEKFSLFINFENFTDTRQTKFDTIYTGPVSNPQFRDIYAPVDGFVINGGFKVRL